MDIMSKTQTITYLGKTIFFMNFSGLKTEPEIDAVIKEGKAYIRKQAAGSTLSLADITDMHFNTKIKELFRDYIKDNKPYIKASAIVGVTGLKQFIFNGVLQMSGRDVKAFNDATQAKMWLASHK